MISITYDDTGSTAVLSCPKGYTIIGDVSSICLENGLWSNTNTSECIIVGEYLLVEREINNHYICLPKCSSLIVFKLFTAVILLLKIIIRNSTIMNGTIIIMIIIICASIIIIIH